MHSFLVIDKQTEAIESSDAKKKVFFYRDFFFQKKKHVLFFIWKNTISMISTGKPHSKIKCQASFYKQLAN